MIDMKKVIKISKERVEINDEDNFEWILTILIRRVDENQLINSILNIKPKIIVLLLISTNVVYFKLYHNMYLVQI
jgi:hypothetical protein